MSRRTLVVFWAAVAAAVSLLGGGVGSVRALTTDGGPANAILLGLDLLGFAVAVLVAGRIAWAAGRAQRRARGR
jgi:hypothetical protein